MREEFLARQREFARCVAELNKSHIGDVRLSRMNRFANFKRQLIELIELMVEARAQELAATMLQEFVAMERTPRAKESRPAERAGESAKAAFALPARGKHPRMPKWVKEESRALRGSPAMRTIR